MQVTPVSSGLSIGSTNWVLETDFHKVRIVINIEVFFYLKLLKNIESQ